jgi:hypothetical protein
VAESNTALRMIKQNKMVYGMSSVIMDNRQLATASSYYRGNYNFKYMQYVMSHIFLNTDAAVLIGWKM